VASTPVTKENQKFTERVHKAARQVVYPRFFSKFGVAPKDLEFESTLLKDGGDQVHAILDGQFAVDTIVRARGEYLHQPLEFWFQERFRRPYDRGKDCSSCDGKGRIEEFSHVDDGRCYRCEGRGWEIKRDYRAYDDITVTAWNQYSNTPSELYKIKAFFFLYGFFNEVDFDPAQFEKCICLSVAKMLLFVASNTLSVRFEENGKRQNFVGLLRPDVRRYGAVIWEQSDVIVVGQPYEAKEGQICLF
jgi:hypothetical protein